MPCPNLAISRCYLSRSTTKPTNWHVRPAKTQISLCIRKVLSETSLWAQREAKDPMFLQTDSEDSDQAARMSRLLWVLVGRTGHFVVFVMRWLISKWSMPPSKINLTDHTLRMFLAAVLASDKIQIKSNAKIQIKSYYCSYLSVTRSKKISNDPEPIQSDPTFCPQNQKGNN